MRKYYSDEDYVQAEYVLYNDLDEDLLPGLPQVDYTVDEKRLEKVLVEGEKWVNLDSYDYPGYVITNYCRIISTKTYRYMTPTLSSQTVHMYIRNEKIHSRQIFQDLNWKYDVKHIRSKFDEYNWKYNSVT